ncbi:glutamate synthase large subunit [Pontivivens insulae]|uniref:Glutamate synthase [NADPH] large chain n=1 Tax=Pontivivens insulae TaxID=1639689 RepID=A0A2R8A817_9RHOB|nr:glutamate synthase large subunit [Pontivivens insulae]RED18475.1 glutamate synthase (NADPH) large subunit [Pontivivens insulae]SPF28373.1 Glutamate synthase [NADPH] large chain [Pontivivens insulae]
MTKFDEAWVAGYEAKAAHLAEKGMYLPEEEHANCGVGLVVSVDGKRSRQVVENGINALKAIWHRGAVDADGKTGDGAGIHVQIPVEFFKDQIARTGHEHRGELIAVGQVFLPRSDFGAQETCRTIVETEVLRMGYTIYGWRHVPVEISCLGEKANATRPEIEQILISNSKGVDEEEFERELYVIRRRIEKAAASAQVPQLYICSLSCRSIIYKGMMLAEQVAVFYPDLMDERFESAFAIYHQRYSTNTFPQWWLAQPFRMLAHNGEINTLKGNLNWLKSHEIRMASSYFGDLAEDIKPIVANGASDSAALDSVFEVMVRAGRNAPMAKTMLVPEAWSKTATKMPQEWLDMYAYSNSVMEPWDGPAALAMTDGRWVCAGLDRNGLRPMRYVVTGDGLVIAGSEVGMVPTDEMNVVEKGALGPGQMLAVDMERGVLLHDEELKDELAASQPFSEWVGRITDLASLTDTTGESAVLTGEALRKRQIAAGYDIEVLETVLHPMVEDAKEALASMGDDTPAAVLSEKYRPLSHYFRQNFSQVTNPPIDSLREHRVMSLKTRFGNLKNVLDETGAQTEILTLESPVLTNARFAKMREYFGDGAVEIDCTFSGDTLRANLDRVRSEAEQAVRAGANHIILTDEHVDADKVAMPMILATSAVHSWLTGKGLRTFCSINVRAAECVDPHYFAVLVGSGATTVNAWLAQDSVADRIERGLLDGPLSVAMDRFAEAINQGLLKIMSKMGISVISSYRGGLNFEAVGLSRAMCAEFFPGMPSRISGIGINGIQKNANRVHARAYASGTDVLPVGGFYKSRKSGESHAWEAQLMHMMQAACDRGSYKIWQEYSAAMTARAPIHLRDLLGFKTDRASIPVEEVESITSIRKRFVTPGMSLGALSPEAHKTLNVAMNRIGAKSDSGEGGEDPKHFFPEPNGDNPSAKIKQVASGRFGVTAEYLNHCQELEIKVAQGAKPGEGGQLPGFKVTEMIAKLRHSTPGVTLISPPPHHDIYSIEDLAQLIYDLKQINPDAKVCVKLVAQTGVGTIAAGVAKAKADVILISGHNGGTGASPQTSIKHAGLPWEMGLSEAHQVLSLNNLRDRVTLRTDGGLRTGRDIVIAAMMGAEEYGIGTAALIAMGCIMVRQCQSNTCPVGVCTQDQALRDKFTGNADKVVNLITFYAQEVREVLASIGARSLDEVIGRADMLTQVSRGSAHLDDLDLNPMLIAVDDERTAIYDRDRPRQAVPDTLDAKIVRDAQPFFKDGEKMQLSYAIQNTDRTVGTRVSSHIVRRFGMRNELQTGHLTVKLEGSAGQSLGAFAAPGLKLEVSGDANDYVGKGLSGAQIVVKPVLGSPLDASENTIIGNTVLYGATDGTLFAAGRAGERFCVRNSGAKVVIEGCGSNGCEYMTGGVAVILGKVGDNFGAGMTGGMAFVYDAAGDFDARMNGESIISVDVDSAHWEGVLRGLIEQHFAETGSRKAEQLLRDWALELPKFRQICPKEMLERLAAPLSDTEAAAQA